MSQIKNNFYAQTYTGRERKKQKDTERNWRGRLRYRSAVKQEGKEKRTVFSSLSKVTIIIDVHVVVQHHGALPGSRLTLASPCSDAGSFGGIGGFLLLCKGKTWSYI